MARRVLIGCANCKRCSGSTVGNATVGAARATGSLTTAAMTGGLSLFVPRKKNKKCGACRHKQSDHV
jgi:hypothetical protein